MSTRRRVPLARMAPLAALLAFTACDEDASSLDYSVVAEVLSDLEAQLEPLVAAASAVDSLRDRVTELEAEVGTEIWSAVTVPESLHGATFVRAGADRAYEMDPERSDAPEVGVRIAYYWRHDNGEFVIPLRERGYIDLSDWPLSGQPRLRVEVSDEDTVICDLFLGAGGGLDDFGNGSMFMELAGTVGGEGWTLEYDRQESYFEGDLNHESVSLVLEGTGGAVSVLGYDVTIDPSGSELSGNLHVESSSSTEGERGGWFVTRPALRGTVSSPQLEGSGDLHVWGGDPEIFLPFVVLGTVDAPQFDAPDLPSDALLAMESLWLAAFEAEEKLLDAFATPE